MMDGGRLGAGAESAVGASTRRFLLVDGFFVDSDLTSAVDTAEKDQFNICSEYGRFYRTAGIVTLVNRCLPALRPTGSAHCRY